MPKSDTALTLTAVNLFGLLAKWRESMKGYKEPGDFRPSRGFWLTGKHGHIDKVLRMHKGLWAIPYYIGDTRFQSFGHALFYSMDLGSLGYTLEKFKKETFLSCLIHDGGKSGGEFQGMLWPMEMLYIQIFKGRAALSAEEADRMRKEVEKIARYRQAFRHEFLSAILMYEPGPIRDWFQRVLDNDMEGYSRVLAAVFGHHLKAILPKALRDKVFLPDCDGREYVPKPVHLGPLSKTLRAHTQHMDEPFPLLETCIPDYVTSQKAMEDIFNRMVADPLFSNKDDDRISSAVKWMLDLADVLGSLSNLPGETPDETDERILTTLAEAFGPVEVDYQDRIDKDIGEGTPLRDFQEKCRVSSNLLVRASTGGGKSVAILAWASVNPSLHLIHALPTTDTTAKLFQTHNMEGEDSLRTSRAWLDLRHVNHNQEGVSKTEKKEEEEESQAVADVIRNLFAPVTWATVDQILGVLAFYRKSILWLPYILKSQIAFDEMHSYDPHLMAWYTRFLEWFPKIRTAHVSATIPDTITKTLNDLIHPVEVVEEAGVDTAAGRLRYHIHVLDDPQDARQHFGPGVLWVANTVARCQGIGMEDADIRVYHSRFRHQDRKVICDAITATFKTPKDEVDSFRPDCRVVGTQVVELSLDMSAWAMITEVCPPASFIQRIGRVNRSVDATRIADIYVYMPTPVPDKDSVLGWHQMSNGLPYSTGFSQKTWQGDYNRWLVWLKQFDGQEVSKATLEEEFQRFYNDPQNRILDRKVYTNLLCTERRNLRHAVVTVPCLLRSDYEDIKATNPKEQGYLTALKSIPVILTPDEQRELRKNGDVFRYHFIVDDKYNHRLGYGVPEERPLQGFAIPPVPLTGIKPGRPSKNKLALASSSLSVRMSKDEAKILKAKAKEAGESLSRFLVLCALTHPGLVKIPGD